jgi:hypothetical protein
MNPQLQTEQLAKKSHKKVKETGKKKGEKVIDKSYCKQDD